jgi:ligand-binding SRPBCC domain-containing protein
VSKLALTLHIAAPIERCFDLSRSIDLHQHSLGPSGDRVVSGVMSALLGMGESVTWETTHFGIKQRLTSRITEYGRPRHFRDSMVAGSFRRFDHEHHFEADRRCGTVVRDVFDFEAPLGMLGRLAEMAFLTRYMRRLLAERNAVLKRVAESEEWRAYLATDVRAG